MGRAAGLAENILDLYHDRLPGGVSLVPSKGGVFEISLGDDLLYSKKSTGRFPRPNEVESALEARLNGAKLDD